MMIILEKRNMILLDGYKRRAFLTVTIDVRNLFTSRGYDDLTEELQENLVTCIKDLMMNLLNTKLNANDIENFTS